MNRVSCFILLASVAGMLQACATKEATSSAADVASAPAAATESIVTRADDEKSARIAAFLDAYMRGDFVHAEGMFQPDAKFYWSDIADPMGLAAWNEAVRMQHKAFRDFRMMNRSIVTTTYPNNGTWTYVWAAWQATSKATGQPLTLPLHLAYRWDGDRVSEEWGLFDAGRFRDELSMNLARLEASDAPAPWDWVLGTWVLSGGDAPEQLVRWTQPEPGVDLIVGDWVLPDGGRAVEVLGWEPEFGRLTGRLLGTDGSTTDVVYNGFGPGRSMQGTYRARAADGTVEHGRIEVVRIAEDRMTVRFDDADGTTVERVFRPAAIEDERRMSLPVVATTTDWRTRMVHEVHQRYLVNDIDAMAPLFSDDCVHLWGDPGDPADNAAWRQGLERHHEIFKDIRLDKLFEMTGEYPDGQIWTASWFEWRGTVRATGEPVELLVHAAHRWDGDKVVEEGLFFDVDRFAQYFEGPESSESPDSK